MVVFTENFNSGIDFNFWQTINLGTANTNFTGSDGNSLYFSGTGTRQALTRALDVSAGGSVSFELIFGSSSNGGENADAGEDVVLEYSTDGVNFTTLKTYDTEAFTSFTTITVNIPTAAQTTATQFRWRQVSNSGSSFDNWALDNVVITGKISQPPTGTVTVGDDFDPATDLGFWERIDRGTANANFTGSNGNSLFFSGTGTRQALTRALDVSAGGSVSFELIFGSSSNGGENADAGEDVVLEYSTDGVNFTTLKTYDTEAFTSFTTITVNIPTAAQTTATQFRWRQVSNSGSSFDNWALDNVAITSDSGAGNQAPTAQDATFSLAENSANGTIVGTVTATDPDNDGLNYSITAVDPDGDSNPAFAIDNSGVITVSDTDDLDFEATPTFSLTVTVDDRQLTDTATVTINLTDVLDYPLLINNGLIPVTNHQDMVFEPTRELLYITTDDGELERFDLNTQSLLSPISVGNVLNGADITPDGTQLVVAEDVSGQDQGFVHLVDLTDNTVSTVAYTLDFGEIGAWDIAVGSNGSAFVTTDYGGSGWTSLRELDLTTGTFTARTDSLGSGFGGEVRQNTRIQRSADRSLLLFTEANISSGPIFTYDAATDTFDTSLNTGSFMGNVSAVNRDGSIVAVDVGSDLVLYDENLNPLSTLPGLDEGAIFSPVEDVLYVVDDVSDEIIAYETNNWKEVTRFAIGEDIGRANSFFSYDQVLEITDDGDFLFVRTSAGIRVIDTPDLSGVPTVQAATFSLAENSANNTVVGTVIATDPDNDVLTYSITAVDPDGDGTPAFTIDNSGVITVNDSDDLDFETTLTFNLTVTVDDGQLTNSAAVTIDLTDVAEAPVPIINGLIPVTNHQDMVFDPTRELLYITTDDGKVERFDLKTQSLLSRIHVGDVLNGADITPDGTQLVVAEDVSGQDQGFVHLVDLTDNTVSTVAYTLDFGEIGAWDIAVGSNGSAFVTTDYGGSGWTSLRELDLTTGTFTARTDSLGSGFGGEVRQNTRIQRSADRSLLLFTEANISSGPIFTYDAATDTFDTSLNTGSFMGNVSAVNRDGSIVAVDVGSDLVLYDENLNPLSTLPGLDEGAIFSPVEDVLYVVDDVSDEIIAYETNNWKEVTRFAIGEDIGRANSFFSYDQVLEITDDGDFLFVRTSAGIRVIDTPDLPGVPTVQAATFSLSENSANNTVVGTVTATDPDNDVLTYSITAIDPDGDGTPAFALDNNGVITVSDSGDLDFETTPTFYLTVTVDDGQLTDTATVTINLSDVFEQNTAPLITFDSAASVSIAENTTAVATITATDADNDSLSFFISGGDDSSLFTIDANTGDLAFQTAPDFETPGDADVNNLYIVEVQVSDGKSGTDSQLLSLAVTDVSESATPGNLLVVSNVFNGSINAPTFVAEYATNGALIHNFGQVPAPGGTAPTTEQARDVVSSGNGFFLYNGTFDPYLAEYDSLTGTCIQQTFSGWSTVNNLSYGGLARAGNFVYATDMRTFGAGDTPQGIVRFNTSDGSAIRFAENDGGDFIDLNIGLDGYLYALDSDENSLFTYDLQTLSLLGITQLAEDVRGIAVDSNGGIYGSSFGDRSLYAFAPDGSVLNSLGIPSRPSGDIDLRGDGLLAAGSSDGDVIISNTNLTGFSTFAPISDGETFLAFT